jgi:hypothetical protein
MIVDIMYICLCHTLFVIVHDLCPHGL